MEAARKGGKAVQEGEVKKERSTGHNPEECPVCLTVFDDTVQRPRTLPCGHTACTLCVNNLKQQGHVACPECRVSHAVPEGGQFPVSYIAEALIRRKRDADAGVAGKKKAAGLSRIMQEQEASVVSAITAFQEVQTQLDQYQTTLRGWGEQQQQLEDRLQGLLDQSRSARELVREEESRAAAKKEAAREGERQLHAALETLHTPTTDKERGVAIVEVFRCTDETEKVLEECRGSFPDVNTATTVMKVREASNAALEAFRTAMEVHLSVQGEEPFLQSEAESTIEDRLQAILTPSLKADDLHSPTQPVRRLLEAGLVFGVNQVEGQRRHARISLEADRVYLHTLKEGPLPSGALTLEVNQVVPPSPPCVVFFDLSWPGRAPQRVHIHLSPNTPLGRQAVLLCTGQRGPSYAGTRLFSVLNKGLPAERVYGGDYESNDGTGGAALLPCLDEGEYRKSGKAGAVWARYLNGDPVRGAQFGITVRDRQDGCSYVCVFGEVAQGLDALMAAAQHTPITEVIIKDCGVVLWG